MTNLPTNPKPHFEKFIPVARVKPSRSSYKKDLNKALKIIEENQRIEEKYKGKVDGYIC